MGRNKKQAYSKREEEKANKLIKRLFLGFIILALLCVGYAICG